MVQEMIDKPFGWHYRLSEFFEKHFPFRIRKIPVHAGLDCPNRDGTLSALGCNFCYNPSFSPFLASPGSIQEQIRASYERLSPKGRENTRFLAYFQSYTNTYGKTNLLQKMYREALSSDQVIGLSISTRPDCISDEVLDILEEYAEDKHIWLEYGLQSAHDQTLLRINRGHTAAHFSDAVERTKNRGIFICAHVILGLPGEGMEEIMETVRFLNASQIDGVKIHHLQVIKNTTMAEEYSQNKFKVFSYEEYLEILVNVLELISPHLVIHRLMSEVTDPKLLIAPHWKQGKAQLHQEVEKLLKRRSTFQGVRYR
ncbi:TIGR01212 family radical SAM protein [Candidatus Contubernalis alkaliaceticus]|uniref:TIGR01212 family radical SAM protein n=1 Tax=Candidatus Contubernalis alkaliaceticus TaxID=338645 RepID=UPI001F4BDF51|nr:TIGR01212 family radical SAM protein [Candidatus Contubernalis alkalaceticus]UNC92265.1 TIGR01212 family radical SAM protein [Candidatus Contubernalis alkalaceticus]